LFKAPSADAGENGQQAPRNSVYKTETPAAIGGAEARTETCGQHQGVVLGLPKRTTTKASGANCGQRPRPNVNTDGRITLLDGHRHSISGRGNFDELTGTLPDPKLLVINQVHHRHQPKESGPQVWKLLRFIFALGNAPWHFKLDTAITPGLFFH